MEEDRLDARRALCHTMADSAIVVRWGMFLGHFAAGLLCAPLAPRAPLWVLLAAPQVLDIAWPVLVATGIERAHVEPGRLAASPLVLEHMPYSHSLIAAVLWAVLCAALYRRWSRDGRGALVVLWLVASHWLLDVIAHEPDVPVFFAGPKLGLGLWRSLPGTLAVELLMFAGGVLLYERHTRPTGRLGRYGFYGLAAFLVVAFLGSLFGPPPPDIKVVLAGAGSGLVLVVFSYFIGKQRQPV